MHTHAVCTFSVRQSYAEARLLADPALQLAHHLIDEHKKVDVHQQKKVKTSRIQWGSHRIHRGFAPHSGNGREYHVADYFTPA